MTDQYDTVSLEFDDGITTLTLDRPEKKNAINPDLIEEMRDEVIPRLEADAYDPDGGTNVLVLTGAGDAFCAGMDLNEFFLDNADDPERMYHIGRRNLEWFEALYEFPQPTIAAVNGWCFGGGLALMCCCDLAIAAEDATLGLSEVRWGILPAGGATFLPAQSIARRDFLELSLTGREIDGSHAARIRLVNVAASNDELDDVVRSYAEEINQLHPMVTRYAKEVYYHEMDHMTFDHAAKYEIGRNFHLNKVTEGENEKALRAFSDDKFKPGLEPYSTDDISEYE